jgi:acyl carrier protein
MTPTEPLEKLKHAFITALALSPDTDVVNAQYGDTEGWDSVAHMALVVEIESAFDIMLDTEEVIGMNSFAKAREILRNHEVAAGA